MKILIVSQRFWPENFRINDIAESLVSFGHQVTVLTGLPNYPKGYILDEYKRGQNRTQTHNGINIIRAKEIGRRKGVFFRFLNYWSFPHYANKVINKISSDFDVVLINGLSPVMSAYPALKYAKKHNKKTIMYEMDLWPESLLAGGISNKSLIYKHYRKVSSKIYAECSKILVSTKEHIDYIKELPNCQNLDIEYLPQYADTIFEESHFEKLDNGFVDLVFAGNIGKAQSIETIIKATSILKDDDRFKFHIVGDGSELENIKKLSKELNATNVSIYGSRPLSEMPSFYQLADAMLVSLEDKKYANMTIPGKVQTYMASGKPIIGSINGSCANFIKNNQIGFVCEAENPESLARLIKGIDVNTLNTIGIHSREVYFSEYSKELFMKKLQEQLNILSSSNDKKK